MGARMMMLPIVAAYGGYSALCNQRAVARAQWGVEQIEQAVNSTELQRPELEDFKSAAAKAIDLTTGVCPRAIPRTSNERWTFTERRLTAIAQAVATIRPSFEAFYVSLSEEQKARLDAGPRRWRWRR
jgi:LTXXQ motif family protein